MQDRELVSMFKEGSQLAFQELYVRYKKNLTHFCNRLLNDEQRAEDVAHDIFIQILETRENLNPDLSFLAYLQTIAKNRIVNEFKKYDVHMRYAKHVLMHENEATNQTENLIIDNDYAKILKEIVGMLTPKQKEVFMLSRTKGMTYNEIAKILDISLPTVQKHASLALEKIKRLLTKHANIHFK